MKKMGILIVIHFRNSNSSTSDDMTRSTFPMVAIEEAIATALGYKNLWSWHKQAIQSLLKGVDISICLPILQLPLPHVLLQPFYNNVHFDC